MRLIDADALNLDYEVEMADDWKTAHEMANHIKYAPTIDAVPVVRGEWLINSDGYYPYCSNCKDEPHGGELTNFCPNCGADMRGKVVVMSKEYPDEDYPCDDCSKADFCDGWEAQFCCTLCEYLGGGDCDNCDSMDI